MIMICLVTVIKYEAQKAFATCKFFVKNSIMYLKYPQTVTKVSHNFLPSRHTTYNSKHFLFFVFIVMYSILYFLSKSMRTNNCMCLNLIYDQLSLKATIVLLYRRSDGITILDIVFYLSKKRQLSLSLKPLYKNIVYLELTIVTIPVNQFSLKATFVLFYQISGMITLLVILFHNSIIEKFSLEPFILLLETTNMLLYQMPGRMALLNSIPLTLIMKASFVSLCRMTDGMTLLTILLNIKSIKQSLQKLSLSSVKHSLLVIIPYILNIEQLSFVLLYQKPGRVTLLVIISSILTNKQLPLVISYVSLINQLILIHKIFFVLLYQFHVKATFASFYQSSRRRASFLLLYQMSDRVKLLVFYGLKPLFIKQEFTYVYKILYCILMMFFSFSIMYCCFSLLTRVLDVTMVYPHLLIDINLPYLCEAQWIYDPTTSVYPIIDQYVQ